MSDNILVKLQSQLSAMLEEVNQVLQNGNNVTTFQHVYEKYIAENQHRTKDYLRKFKATQDYFHECFGDSFSVHQMNKATLSQFISFLNAKKITEPTVKNHVKRLKLILRNEIDVSFFVKMNAYSPERIALSKEELQLIEAYEPEGTLQFTKDIFLFACYTGLRFGDLMCLKPSNIQKIENRTVLRINQQKTRKDVIIPLSQKALKIIEKYHSTTSLFPKISNQRINEKLKVLALRAGIIESVQKIYYVNNERIQEVAPKWKYVSCHTARHTYASLLAEKNVELVSISKALGHSNVATTNAYLHNDTAKAIDDILAAME